MPIRTVRHGVASLFQSMIDNVLHRQAPAGSARPTLADPHIHAATVVAEHIAAGAEPPHAPPEAVVARNFSSASENENAAGAVARNFSSASRESAAAHAWHCMKLVSQIFLAKIEGRHERAAELEAEYKDGTCDPGWVEAIREYLEYYGLSGHKRAVPYIPCRSLDQCVAETLPPNATILLIGDWGTGTEAAKALLHEAASHDPDLFIHLGDIYYAGTHHEAQANFLAIVNEAFDRSTGHLPVYNLTGNHDMYAGGVGYFDLLSQLNPSPPFLPEQAQRASFFCLRNSSRTFQLLAMDTGLHDGDPFAVTTDITWLEPAEAAWHLDKIDRFHAQGGRTILLSHHQLFSAFDPIGDCSARPAELQAYNPKLLDTFRGALEAGQVMAWFWGHEHNLGIYEPYGPLARGRCIGHGAIPVLGDADPYGMCPAIANPPQLVKDPDTGEPVRLPVDADGSMYRHGYVILRLDDQKGTAEAEYYLAGDPTFPFYRETMG